MWILGASRGRGQGLGFRFFGVDFVSYVLNSAKMKHFALILLAALTWSVNAQTTCVDPLACNFTELGECEFLDDNGMPCVTEGCAIPGACNFNPEADINDGSCEFTSCLGCTDEAACNYDPEAVYLDLSCIYFVDCNGVCGGDWIEDECGNCYGDGDFVEEESLGWTEFFPTGQQETIQVPEGVSYGLFVVAGASGGASSDDSWGGFGAHLTAKVPVISGEYLTIAVGEAGSSGAYNVSGGGGGGSFVARGDVPLVVAGGGGGDGLPYYSYTGPLSYGGSASLDTCVNPLNARVLDCNPDDSCNSFAEWTYVQSEGGSGGNGFAGAGFFESSGYGAGSFINGGSLGGVDAPFGWISVVMNSGGFGGGGQGGNGGGGGGGYRGGHGGLNQGCTAGVEYVYGGGGGGSSYCQVLPESTAVREDHGDGYIAVDWIVLTSSAPDCELGCVVPQACNFNPEATNDDGSCDFCFCGPGTAYSVEAGQCLVVGGGSDINGDGCTNLGDLLDLLAGYGTCQE